MLARLLFAVFAVLAVSVSAADPDPCLAEDYAEANCARSPCSAHPSITCWHAHMHRPAFADGTCCAQGGYKLEGHGCVLGKWLLASS